ncbi:FAD-binding protein [soil metagenome]
MAGIAAPVLAVIKAPARLARVRPGAPGWPDAKAWAALNRQVEGRLVEIQSPLVRAIVEPNSEATRALFAALRNPYFIGDDPALTQSLGLVDGWTSRPSAYAVAAGNARDFAAAVDFARTRRVRLVVKGGGHSYHGTSNAPDSLLVWTRAMKAIELHDAFVGQGCQGRVEPATAVSVGAGAMWMHVYDAVTTRGGRYVQGGGCGTVGVAGLVQSGGFGSLSKNFGTAAANLLEAEVVTADGVIRIANACTNPDLYWALKGGGGGSFGVVTRLTLRTHALPAFIGAAFMTIEATSDSAFRRLVEDLLDFYRDTLMVPQWGEQIRFTANRRAIVNLVFQGIDQAEAQATWQPFLDRVRSAPDAFALIGDPFIAAIPGRSFWDPEFWKRVPGVMKNDDRPGAPAINQYWASNGEEAGQVLTGYHTAWLPRDLLDPGKRGALVDALLEAAGNWSISLHFNKGLAGAPASAIAATRDTATNPAVLDAFALAICAGEQPPAYPGVAGHEPDLARGRRDAAQIRAAFEPLKRLLPKPAAYVSESDFFDPDWKAAYWGEHYERLVQIKRRLDPHGLFHVHHGIDSDAWDEGGFSAAESRGRG